MDEWLYQAVSAEAKLDDVNKRLHLLETFYKEVVKLTVEHDVIKSIDGNTYASVSPKNLGNALEKIDELWYLELDRNDDELTDLL